MRLRVWLSAWFITSRNVPRTPSFRSLADTVENDDGIVGGEADDGQDGGHGGGVELRGRRPDRQYQPMVMSTSWMTATHGADGERELIAERHVDQDAEQRQQRGDDGRVSEFPCRPWRRRCPGLTAEACLAEHVRQRRLTTLFAVPIGGVHAQGLMPAASSFGIESAGP